MNINAIGKIIRTTKVMIKPLKNFFINGFLSYGKDIIPKQ